VGPSIPDFSPAKHIYQGTKSFKINGPVPTAWCQSLMSPVFFNHIVVFQALRQADVMQRLHDEIRVGRLEFKNDRVSIRRIDRD